MRQPAHVHVMSIQPPGGIHVQAFAYFTYQPSKIMIKETLDRYFSVGSLRAGPIESLKGHDLWTFKLEPDSPGDTLLPGYIHVKKAWYEGRKPSL